MWACRAAGRQKIPAEPRPAADRHSPVSRWRSGALISGDVGVCQGKLHPVTRVSLLCATTDRPVIKSLNQAVVLSEVTACLFTCSKGETMEKAGRLQGKVAIITGGASGIGEAAVKLFISEGCRVVIADVRDDLGEELSRELGPDSLYIHTDVSSEEQVKAAVKIAVDRFGRLDCMFNNAGIGEDYISIEEIELEHFQRIVDINLRGAFLGMKHAAPVMKKQKAGSIINTASIAAFLSGRGGHIYSATKAALIGFTRSVAVELGESHVRANCICPGSIVTPIFAHSMGRDDLSEQQREFIKKGFEFNQPIPRAGLPEDVANAALWLASDDSSFVTGTAIVIDGGQICGSMWAQSLQRSELGRQLFKQ